MPTNRRRRRRTRTPEFTASHVSQLISGWDFFGDAYGDGTRVGGPGPDLELMQQHWEQHRVAVFARFHKGAIRSRLRPWAWWQFDQGYDRAPYDPLEEAEELHALGEWTDDDVKQLEFYARALIFLPSQVARFNALGVQGARSMSDILRRVDAPQHHLGE